MDFVKPEEREFWSNGSPQFGNVLWPPSICSQFSQRNEIMRLRVVDGLLILAILAGGDLVWRTNSEQRTLKAEHDRLVRRMGELKIAEPDKVHILALPTDDPLHFAWRVYLPPNYQLQIRHSTGGSTSMNTSSCEFIARVRFRENAQGRTEVYSSYTGGSGLSSFGDASLTKFLQQHAGELDVEQLGSERVEILSADQGAVLLRVAIPDSLLSEAEATISESQRKRYSPVIYELGFGPSGPGQSK